MAQSQFSSPARFHSSPLVRLLTSLDIGPVAESTQSFAEKLSHWVAWTDAIALSRVLAAAAPTQAPSSRPTPAGGVRHVIEQVGRVRRELTESIVHDALLRQQEGDAAAAGHVDGRRQYRAHQHTMEDRIGRLRCDVRSALAGTSPRLGQLAALDAVLDVALAGHQRRLLEKVPLLLEKRVRAMHATNQEAALKNPDPNAMPSAPAANWRHCLLAELELRLQPVQGMVDTLGRDACQTP